MANKNHDVMRMVRELAATCARPSALLLFSRPPGSAPPVRRQVKKRRPKTRRR